METIMLDPKKIEDIAKQIGNALPPQLKQFADDAEAKVKQILQQKLANLDFVSREEFDVQRQVLLRTREKIEQLEQQVAALLAQNVKPDSQTDLPTADQL
jgi:BMFP domain-containing protein YqiC